MCTLVLPNLVLKAVRIMTMVAGEVVAVGALAEAMTMVVEDLIPGNQGIKDILEAILGVGIETITIRAWNVTIFLSSLEKC